MTVGAVPLPAAPSDEATPRWHDPKRHLWVLGTAMPLLPFVAMAAHARTGNGAWLWLGPIFILGVLPLVDWLGGDDGANPPEAVIRALEADPYYRWLAILFVPLQYAGFVAGFAYLAADTMSVAERTGLAVTLGFIGGLGINAAHELGHRRERLERWLSRVALAQTFYGHFQVEHNRGHHVRVATPEDPASARLGESLWAFLPRTVLGSLTSAWALEGERYARRGVHPFRMGNEIVIALLLSLTVWGALLWWLGAVVLPYLVVQAAVGIALLEAVNYLQHYGLLRQLVDTPEGPRRERVAPRHSWNSNRVATNVVLFHLQRHSDHHAHPSRHYQSLRDDTEAPVLPSGYAAMILLALVPPLWRRVMDPRVVAHYGGVLERANRGPRAGDRP
ncbi:MAG: alkane 1-monooxygenase [Gemmatimonadetes bacterium]|nr:alkane 1-monooxygenase [Gemmatimonadota bacterium]